MKINNLDIIIGSDPELFVKKGDEFISGHDLIPGTKQKPYPVRGGAVQVDGTALEFNTKPARTRKAFHLSVNAVLRSLNNMIPDDLKLVAEPTAFYGQEYMDTLPEHAKELGCDPDYNAYDGLENPKPNGEKVFRTGAGHIHVGWTQDADITDPEHLANCRAVIQAMDMFLGVPSVLIDGDQKRRQLYGKAGAFRPKPYGVEYRVLSNFWVMNSRLRTWVFDNTMLAVERLMDRDKPLINRKDLSMVINYGYQDDALNFIQKHGIPMPTGYSIKTLRRKLGKPAKEHSWRDSGVAAFLEGRGVI